METRRILPKSNILHQCEMIQQVTDCLNIPDEMFTINIGEVERLETTLENTSDNADFFQALHSIRMIHKNVAILAERLKSSFEEAKERICETCGGSGEDGHPNDPAAPACKDCRGGLI